MNTKHYFILLLASCLTFLNFSLQAQKDPFIRAIEKNELAPHSRFKSLTMYQADIKRSAKLTPEQLDKIVEERGYALHHWSWHDKPDDATYVKQVTFLTGEDAKTYLKVGYIKNCSELKTALKDFPQFETDILRTFIYRFRSKNYPDTLLCVLGALESPKEKDKVLSKEYYKLRGILNYMLNERLTLVSLDALLEHIQSTNDQDLKSVLEGYAFYLAAEQKDSRSLEKVLNYTTNDHLSEKIEKELNFRHHPAYSILTPLEDKRSGMYVLKDVYDYRLKDKFAPFKYLLIYACKEDVVMKFSSTSDFSKSKILTIYSKGDTKEYSFHPYGYQTMAHMMFHFEDDGKKLFMGRAGILGKKSEAEYNRFTSFSNVYQFYDLEKIHMKNGKLFKETENKGCLIHYPGIPDIAWTGDCDNNGFATGKGRIEVLNSEEYAAYEGELKEGLFHGDGCLSGNLTSLFFFQLGGKCGQWKEGKFVPGK